jgi:hypothetical protein
MYSIKDRKLSDYSIRRISIRRKKDNFFKSIGFLFAFVMILFVLILFNIA